MDEANVIGLKEGPLKDAIKSYYQEQAYQYKTAEDVTLESTEDAEKWKPSKTIKETIKNTKCKVRLLSDTDLTKLYRKIVDEVKRVAIVVMGPVIDRSAMPYLIVLIVGTDFFVISPEDKARGIQYLKMLLQAKGIEFWTTNGLQEADSLYHNLKIDLTKANANCCSGLHINLMHQMNRMPNQLLKAYPLMAQDFARARHVKIERFEKLVEIWLDIDKMDFQGEMSAMVHLKTQPLSLTGKNLIKKRCLLVMPLVNKLRRMSDLEARLMSLDASTRLIATPSRKAQAFMLHLAQSNRKKGCARATFLNHLTSGTAIYMRDVYCKNVEEIDQPNEAVSWQLDSDDDQI